MKQNPHPNHNKQVKRELDRFRKKAETIENPIRRFLVTRQIEVLETLCSFLDEREAKAQT